MTTKAEAAWSRMCSDREQFLDQAIDNSSLTIPSLIPESARSVGLGRETGLNSLYQGLGARGLGQLASKVLTSLMPPQEPFFRMVLDEGAVTRYIEQTGGSLPPDAREKLMALLARQEKAVIGRLNKMRVRSKLSMGMRHLLCGGNVLLYLGGERLRVYIFAKYCQALDPEGRPLEVVIKEEVSPQVLKAMKPRAKVDPNGAQKVCVYTHIKWDYAKDRVEWVQQDKDGDIPDTSGNSPIAGCPWIPLSINRIDGEDYGRAPIEEFLGDLASLNELTRAQVEAALQMSKVVWSNNPNGMTRAQDFAMAENGDVIAGSDGDLTAITAGDKVRELQGGVQVMGMLERRLGYSFLLTESVQRDAERVTAEEIRLMAESLDSGLAGLYSDLSDQLQLPMVQAIVYKMTQAKELEPLPEELVSPQVTTGLDAIGARNERNRLLGWIQTLQGAIGPEGVMQRLKVEPFAQRLASYDHLEVDGLVMTEEEIAGAAQQEQQARLAETAVAGAMNGTGTPPPTA